MAFTTKNPSGNAETRKSAAGNDAKDGAPKLGAAKGRDTGLRKGSDTGLTAVEFAKKYSGECKAERGPFKSGGVH